MKKSEKEIVVIGGGPGGLMAAEILASSGLIVTVIERKSGLGRKFLRAGIGGLNITHSENIEDFMKRYGKASEKLRPAIENFPPAALRSWCEGLGEKTFVGSSGRVFPKSFKASPLLRAWKEKLEKLGVKFIFKHQWLGWDDKDNLIFSTAEETIKTLKPAATILALGGASWPKLGSDGSWVEILQKQKITIEPLRPANCGFTVNWSEIFINRFVRQPLKPVKLHFLEKEVRGEVMITEHGIEGGAVYALSAAIRDEIAKNGSATINIDLRPDVSFASLVKQLSKPRGNLSFSNFWRKAANLSPIIIGLLREIGGKDTQQLSPDELAALIKKLPLKLNEPLAIDRAISTAGGVKFEAVDGYFMLNNKPNVFVVGEMLDWEAPTGGYLLQATFSTAAYAAKGLLLRINNI